MLGFRFALTAIVMCQADAATEANKTKMIRALAKNEPL